MPRGAFLLTLCCLPFVIGCEGCRSGSRDSQEQEDAPLNEFSARPALAFPAGQDVTGSAIKPGHWTTAAQTLKSNRTDARGDLESRVWIAAENANGQPSGEWEGELPSIRPAVLPKGQQRRFDFRILPPAPSTNAKLRSFLGSRFVASDRNAIFDTGRQPLNVLRGEEYFFVVLTTRPERFAKLQVSDWVRPYRDELSFKTIGANYKIIFPPSDQLLPLPETMLDWTHTAYLLWDDVDPDAMTPAQQRAINDWIHFGGQLIVNGPEAAEVLARSSLQSLLPLQPSGQIELDADAGEQLLRGWSVSTDRSTEKQIALLRNQTARVAVDGRAMRDASPVAESGGLVFERFPGRGRVVQPRVDITSEWLANWDSYDSFFNSVLMSRPRRELVESTDPQEAANIQQRYPDLGLAYADPAMNTRLRIAARSGTLGAQHIIAAPSPAPSSSSNERSRTPGVRIPTVTSATDHLTASNGVSGVGGWTDDSDIMRQCRQILRQESGITIPDTSLVIRALGYYLLFLVPVNYLVFRFLGRLEYAWIAVPLIALVGAVWVARAARLDIGFARSHTEVGVLEMHAGYPRAHLCRVVAIYNSLSRDYDFQFDSADSCAAPVLAPSSPFETSKTVFRQGDGDGPTLAGFAVASNNVRMLHAEQIIDVSGPIDFDDENEKLVNRTSYELLDAVVVRKDGDGQIEVAALGLVPSGGVVQTRFRNWDNRLAVDDMPMGIGQMIRSLADPTMLPNHATRLVARIEGALPGMAVVPAANQVTAQTVLLAHLQHPEFDPPQPDMNLIGDMRRVLRDDATSSDPTEAIAR